MGLRMLLEGTDSLTPVGQAAGGAEAVRMAAELRPDVVLMDVRVPGMDGLEATRRIVGTGGRARVLIVTTFDLAEYAHDGLRAGASGRLLKDVRPEELVAGTRAVPTGNAVVAPALTRRSLEAHAHTGLAPTGPPNVEDPRLSTHSEREREVLVAIGQGWNNNEIAQRLVLSESKVKKHVSRVLTKIGARDRIQAVILVYDAGLVSAEP
ncbi:response regulator [Streptomyces sp. NPDC048436]|uniref:response regulator n=1 Tax=Streptomyces sp. NPDC048436 TaxID=3365550 RepID=UPI00371D7BD6